MKTYIIPATKVEEAQQTQMIAVSIIAGGVADNTEVLTKENDGWDIWEDD